MAQPSPKKILILGGRGRLASALARSWGARHRVTSLTRAEVDVSDLAALRSVLAQHSFDVLVNGTGMTNVDDCESLRDEAHTVNALAPRVMAASAREKGARFIHFSTDYVFDGAVRGIRTEEDPVRPLSWYGQTKRDGELAVLADSPAHLAVRVSWVFGPDKPSFVDMLIERALKSDQVAAIADKFSSPTFACDVAGWMEPFFEPTMPGGIYHACNAGGCSWRDYGEYALQCASAAGLPLLTTRVDAISLADMKAFKAPRPVHTILSTEKLTRATGLIPRPWQEAVRAYIESHYAPLSPSR